MSLGLGTSLSKSGLITPGIVTDSLVLKHNYAAGGVVPVSDGSAFFVPNSYISLGNDSSLQVGTSDFSLAAWIKRTAADDGAIFAYTVAAGNARIACSGSSKEWIVKCAAPG